MLAHGHSWACRGCIRRCAEPCGPSTSSSHPRLRPLHGLPPCSCVPRRPPQQPPVRPLPQAQAPHQPHAGTATAQGRHCRLSPLHGSCPIPGTCQAPMAESRYTSRPKDAMRPLQRLLCRRSVPDACMSWHREVVVAGSHARLRHAVEHYISRRVAACMLQSQEGTGMRHPS